MDQYKFSLENHVTILFATYGLLHFITDFVNLFSNFKKQKNKEIQTTQIEEIKKIEEIETSESESETSESGSESLIIINDLSDSEPEYDQAYYIRKRRKLI
jgi:hypothetical protein